MSDDEGYYAKRNPNWKDGIKLKQPSELAAPTGLAVVAIRHLTRKETVKCNSYQGYTKEFHYLQYQTSDGKWHDVPNVFEDSTTETANAKVSGEADQKEIK